MPPSAALDMRQPRRRTGTRLIAAPADSQHRIRYRGPSGSQRVEIATANGAFPAEHDPRAAGADPCCLDLDRQLNAGDDQFDDGVIESIHLSTQHINGINAGRFDLIGLPKQLHGTGPKPLWWDMTRLVIMQVRGRMVSLDREDALEEEVLLNGHDACETDLMQ
jgi:hypothetical protein